MRTVVDAIVGRGGGTGTLTILDSTAEPVESRPWRELHRRARAMSAVLAGQGVGPGGRVGLIGDTSADLVTAMQAVWLTGAAVNLLPPVGRRGHLEHLRAVVTDAGLHLVVVDDDLVDMASALAGTTRVLTLGALAARAATAAPAPPHRPDPGDLALLQYTSGSTRRPRGVPVTHRHLAANLEAIRDVLDHEADHPSRILSWLPLYHDMGLIAFLLLPMTCGCSLALQAPSAFAHRPLGWLEAMSRYRITMSGAPNFAYSLMTRLLTAGLDLELDLRSVRHLVSGGEPVDATMMTRFVAAAGRYGLNPTAPMPAYGLAESTLAATVSPRQAGVRVDWVDPVALEAGGRAEPVPPGAGARPLVRVGPPVLGTSVRVVDRHTGQPVGERVVGRVELRGASVVGHYWGDPAPAPGSWLHTGDLGYLAGGELVVCGREKDVLFAAGRNVYPQDVEAVAAEVRGVRPGGAAAFGVPDGHGDRLVVAVEAARPDPAELSREVSAAVLEEVGLAPADVVVLPRGELPRTTSGKLRRAETRRRYLSGELRITRAPVLEGSTR